MSSFAFVSALIVFSSLPVARADIFICRYTDDDDNSCIWNNNHLGLILAIIGAIVGLLLFMAFLVYRFRLQARRNATGPINSAPNPTDPPHVPRPLTLVETRQYPFAVQDARWRESIGGKAGEFPPVPFPEDADYKASNAPCDVPPPSYPGEGYTAV